MDALIRAAQLAPFRTRLREVRVEGSAASDTAARSAQGCESRSMRDTLRDEVETQLRSELTSQMQELYESERGRGHADGYADGLTDAKAAAASDLERVHEQLRAKVDDALSAMERAHQVALSKLEFSVGEVAFAAVCQLVSCTAVSRAFVLGLVEHACAQLRTDTMATARLHPRDIRTLNELLQDDELRIGSLGLKLVPDESLQLGGCLIEAASGRYDAGLENQLRRLHALLAGGNTAEHSTARAQIAKG